MKSKKTAPRRLFDNDFPKPRGDWPQSRNRKDYQALLQQCLPNSYKNPKQATFNPPPGSIIVDVGMGDGNALAEFKREDTTTVGFTLNEYEHNNDDKLDTICFSPIPNGHNARILFDELRNTVTQVFCVFGPCTYADNPIFALIFVGLLLKTGGRADIIVSSVMKDALDKSPIGYALTRQKTRQFFSDHLQLEISIGRTKIVSAVSQGNCFDFLISIKRTHASPSCHQPLDTLFAQAITEIGEPVNTRKNSSWGDFSGNQSIQGKRYCNVLTSWRLDIVAVDIVCSIENVTINVDIGFRFGHSLANFCCAFNEFFSHPHSGWQVTCDNKVAHLTYNDHHLSEMKAKTNAMPVFKNCLQRAMRDLQLVDVPRVNRVNTQPENNQRIAIYRAYDQLNFLFHQQPEDVKNRPHGDSSINNSPRL